FINRKAFQSLLAKAFPCWQSASSNNKSFPAEALNKSPTRTPSAPYSSISPRASGEFPNDFDIFRRCLSRTNPVKYTFSKVHFPVYSYPAITILATQKNKISGPVTRSFVG